jgi:glycosyltransferase involved in cell wall biosynthesis
MRVLTFLHSFEPGGVERIALRLHRAWQERGLDSRLVLGRPDGAMASSLGNASDIFLTNGRIPTAAWETLWMILMLPRVVRRERPDVLFCAGNTYAVVAGALRLSMWPNCPPIVAKVSNDLARQDMIAPFRWGYRQWLRLQARFIDVFVGMAEPMRKEIADAIGVDATRIAIIHDPAIDDADFARPAKAGRKGTGRRFLAVGRLSAQKNFALMLRAFALIARSDDQLTILGEGPDRSELQKLAEALDIADRVDLAGFVTDTSPWFSDSDVFVLSSDYEGVPAVIVEALAAGLPIVATDCSVSMSEMIGDGAFGLLVPRGSVPEFARAMDSVAHLAIDRAGQIEKARAFTIERAADAYRNLFCATVAAKAGNYV